MRQRRGFGPLLAGVHHAPYPDPYRFDGSPDAEALIRVLACLFIPSQESLDDLAGLWDGVTTTAPFSYAYELVTFPGELTVEIGLNIKKTSPHMVEKVERSVKCGQHNREFHFAILFVGNWNISAASHGK